MKVLLTCLLALCAIACGPPQNRFNNELATQNSAFDSIDLPPDQNGRYAYKGVSFASSIPGVMSVRPSALPASPLKNLEDKPDYVQPRETRLELAGPYAERDTYFKPEIRVFPASEFMNAWSLSEDAAVRVSGQVNSLHSMILSKKPQISKPSFLTWVEGSPEIITHVKYVSFANGEGVLYLVPFSYELDLLRDRGLTYIFQGFTSDGKYHVFATFPVSSKLLPADTSTEEHFGFKVSDFSGKQADARLEKYRKLVKTALEKAQAAVFNPDLSTIEKTITSLEVNWQD